MDVIMYIQYLAQHLAPGKYTMGGSYWLSLGLYTEQKVRKVFVSWELPKKHEVWKLGPRKLSTIVTEVWSEFPIMEAFKES